MQVSTLPLPIWHIIKKSGTADAMAVAKEMNISRALALVKINALVDQRHLNRLGNKKIGFTYSTDGCFPPAEARKIVITPETAATLNCFLLSPPLRRIGTRT